MSADLYAGRRCAAEASRASLAVDNLRAIVVLLVLAFHSVLAYLNFLPAAPFQFTSPPYLWRAFPIVDSQRWLGFDLFCAWLDVFLMSFFILLSGLFVWPSLARKGALSFLQDRLLRLGLPFLVVVLVLMPVTQLPTYLQTATAPSLADYWREWSALPFWPCGPMWFLSLLMAADIVATAVSPLLARHQETLQHWSHYGRRHAGRFLAGLVLLSALGYVPLMLLFGPSDWFHRGPFTFQLSRPLHYAMYFFAGLVIGACGIERGLLAPEGPLPGGWRRWGAAALATFALWLGLTSQLVADPTGAPVWLQIADGISFALACFASCFFALAWGLRHAQWRSRVLESLRDNAFGMFLVHYVFVVWLQYALLGAELPAIAKAVLVIAGTVAFSWASSAALRRIPVIADIIGARRRSKAVAVIGTAAGQLGPAAGLAPQGQ